MIVPSMSGDLKFCRVVVGFFLLKRAVGSGGGDVGG